MAALLAATLLPDASAMGDRYFEGQVKLVSGEPAADVLVLAQWGRNGNLMPCTHLQLVRTDAQGRFQIPLRAFDSGPLDVDPYKAGYERMYGPDVSYRDLRHINEPGREELLKKYHEARKIAGAGSNRELSIRPFRGTQRERLEDLEGYKNLLMCNRKTPGQYETLMRFYEALDQEVAGMNVSRAREVPFMLPYGNFAETLGRTESQPVKTSTPSR